MQIRAPTQTGGASGPLPSISDNRVDQPLPETTQLPGGRVADQLDPNRRCDRGAYGIQNVSLGIVRK